MLLIRNAYIKPITGPDIPNGCLLAEDGRITAVAAHIDAPEGCTVIDAGGRLRGGPLSHRPGQPVHALGGHGL